MSLAPYLNEIRVRRVRDDGTILPREAEMQKREEEHLARQLAERIKHSAKIQEAERLMGAGMQREAAAMYRMMADRIDSRAA
jgi:hypothetical protein